MTLGHPQGEFIPPGTWQRQPDSDFQYIVSNSLPYCTVCLITRSHSIEEMPVLFKKLNQVVFFWWIYPINPAELFGFVLTCLSFGNTCMPYMSR